MSLHTPPAPRRAGPPRPAPLLALLCLAALGRAASANTLNVPAQYHTIQAAINASQNGDTVLIADGTYSGPGNVDLTISNPNLTVTSQHGAYRTIIDCGGHPSSDGSGNHRGFLVNANSGSGTIDVISSLTIKNGYESGRNGSDGYGGGIEINGTSATVKYCVIQGSTAIDGGGLYDVVYGDSNGNSSGPFTVTGCKITGNTALNGSGGLSNNNFGDYNPLMVTNCLVTGNSSLGGGAGGMGNYAQGDAFNDGLASGSIVVSNCTLTGNSSRNGDGGGMANIAGPSGGIDVSACTFTGNSAHSGSASPSGDGGGLYNAAASDQSGNNPGSVSVTDCALTGNSADSGGGTYNGDGGYTISVTNCTFTGNSASLGGGAYDVNGYNANSNSLTTLTNDILYGDQGGEIYDDPSSVSSSIVTYCDVGGGYAGSHNINADPLFVNSPADLHLRPGSPCLGAGTASGAPATTLDGRTRPNPPSIGAYEVAPSAKLNTVVAVGARSGKAGTTVTLKSYLKTSGGAVLSGKTLTYTVSGVAAGSAVTDSTGLASLTYTIPANAPAGNEPIVVSFAGDGSDSAGSGKGALTVSH